MTIYDPDGRTVTQEAFDELWNDRHCYLRISLLEAALGSQESLFASCREIGRAQAAELLKMATRIAQLEAALAKEKGGWDAFLKLRKSVAERDFPGMTAEVTAQETKGDGRECGACGRIIPPGGSNSCSLDHAVCEHPRDRLFHHAAVSGRLGDYRCDECDTIVNFSPDQDLPTSKTRGEQT